MNGNRQSLPPLSTKASLPVPRSRSVHKSNTVAPKSKKSPIKAPRKVAPPSVRHARASERRSKLMETAPKLSKYFPRLPDADLELGDPICISSDDGSPTASQVERHQRKHRTVSRFLDCEADCSSDSDTPVNPTPDAEEEEELSGGFIVSDGHLSSDEDDDWGAINRARRVDRQSPVASPPRGKEVEKQRESSSDEMEWSIGAQPSPPMSPVALDSEEEQSEGEEEEVIVPPPVEDLPEPGVHVPNEDLPSGSKFKLQYRYLLLTYKSHLPKAQYIKWFKDLFPSSKQEGILIRLAHEAPDRDPKKCPYRHTHVVVDCGYRLTIKSPHKFCYINPEMPNNKDKCGSIHCNIKGLPGETAYLDAKFYISKEDPENADLKVRIPNEKGVRIVESIQTATSVNMALRKNLRRIGDAAGIIQIYGCRSMQPADVEVPERPTFPWHVELLEEVENKTCPRGDRKIIWYVDKLGLTGKSWFTKYMAVNGVTEETGFSWLCMSEIQEKHDAFYQVKEAIDMGFNKKGFIIDVSRAGKFKQGLYAVLESLKNGIVTSTKYKGCNIKMNTPWVIVFANFWPKTQLMSLDRWDIRSINRETKVAEKLPWDHEAPEEFKHNCPHCKCGQGHSGMRHDIVQERN